MQKGKNLNAMKWFGFAKKIRPDKKEPYLGEAVSAFKLGMVDKCLEIIRSQPGNKTMHERRKKTVLSMDMGDSTVSISNSAYAKLAASAQRASSISDEESKANDDEPEPLITQVKLGIENQFAFLQTICYKKLQKYGKAQREYDRLKEIFQKR